MNRTKSLYLTGALVLALGWSTAVRANEQVYAKTLPCTVWVINEKDGCTGSGVLVDHERRLVVTCAHVVGEATELVIFFPVFDDSGELVSDPAFYIDKQKIKRLEDTGRACLAKVVKRDPSRDLALVELPRLPAGAHALPLARISPKPGQRIHSVGNPGVSTVLWVYSAGNVRQVCRKEFTLDDGKLKRCAHVVESTSPINPGDSGGPVVNDHGELVALVSNFDPNARQWSTLIAGREIHTLLEEYQG